MQKTIFVCDGCGATRGEGNHWWTGYVNDLGIGFGPWCLPSSVTISGLTAKAILHLCGEACCHKVLSEFLARKSNSKGGATDLKTSTDVNT